MVIVSLEIKNFKSYKGLHLVGPFKQFSCIIGPNGSGKSNLMEAIIFVLGYKSSQIRGNNLNELVFKQIVTNSVAEALAEASLSECVAEALAQDGSPDSSPQQHVEKMESFVKMHYHHKPTGKDYVFMRKIESKEKDSTSHYYVDDKHLKYEEYESKLAELDVHVACKNFFVFQGDVISLASQNPKQITALVETVSGSGALKSEYDRLFQEKTAAEDAVMLTYSKKKAISQEKQQINAQLAEAREFREYMSKREDLRVKSILLTLRYRLGQITQLSDQLGSKEVELTTLRREGERFENEQKASSKKQAETHKELLKLEDEMDLLKRSRDKGRPSALKASEEVKQLNDKINKTTHFIERAEKNFAAQQATIEQLRKDLADLERQQTDVESAEVEKSIELDKDQIEQYNKIKLQAGKETADMRRQLDQLTRQQNVETESLMTLSSKLEDLKKMRVQFEQTNEKLIQKRDIAEQHVKEADERLVVLRDALNQMTTSNAQMLSKQSTLTSELDRIQFILSEHKTEQTEKERDRRLNSVISTLKNLYPDVRGKVSDMCEQTQRKYSTALAVAMGKLQDAIIVDTQKTAYACVEYMKEQLYGTATFLPLDRLNPKALNPKLRTLGGTSKLLIDCLKFDKVIEPAIRYVVGNTLVCDSLPEAKKLAFGDANNRQKVVTIQGIKITKTGLMSGGLMGVKSKTKFDASRLDDLKKQRDAIIQELSGMEAKQVSMSDIQQMNNQINELRLSASTNSITLVPIRDRIAKNTAEVALIDKEQAPITPEIQRITESIAERRVTIDSLQNDISAVEEDMFQEFSQSLGIKSIREFEEDRLKKIQQQSSERMALSHKIDRVRNQMEYESSRNLESEINTLRSELEANQEALDREVGLQKGCVEQDNEIEQKLEDVGDKIKKHKETLFTMNTAIKDAKKKVSENGFKRAQMENQILIGLNDLAKIKKDFHNTLLEAKTENMRIPLRGEDEEMAEPEESEKGVPGSQKKTPSSGKTGKRTGGKDERKKKSSSSRKRKTRDEGDKSAGEGEGEEESEAGKTDDDIFHDSDEEELDSDEEKDEAEEENPFLDLVEMASEEMTEAELDALYEAHISIPFDFKLIAAVSVTSEDRLQHQLKEYSHDLHKIKTAMETYNPNLKAYEHFRTISTKLRETIKELDERRNAAREVGQKFAQVRKERTHLFNRAFDSISKKINKIYGDLTRDLYPPYLRGSADLAVEDTSYPFNGGIKYTAIPPNKRFQEMEMLSGGEKSIAALALLFAVHQYKPTPFFVLDEVDAAFDNINVLKLVRYVRSKAAKKKTQFVVISLKEIFFQNSDALVGVCRELDSTSKVLTCSLEHLPIKEVELLSLDEQRKVDKRVLSVRKQRREGMIPEYNLTSATETSASESEVNTD
ncbi:hypothetical protein SAMD00019534_042880 [Acytostelium subglobosum LB1]|uniref:hypothetical protein n=1 Tax=Acytostelium subglobosum LB1 TaxID=1410327 RepID=UPI0006451CC8|nr:hypothetical protein SAMD00019534_042880 [Acytostelium subglobosum LB1]GAM21113.1 hypothetical protein SAMD00019534_042880 [Acytostelium subglobosum LB1]|eukprot:XP_012756247.1 hypothetical protein SAMD00019534_042880 [Acytostelium subglobosum LB1]